MLEASESQHGMYTIIDYVVLLNEKKSIAMSLLYFSLFLLYDEVAFSY
jgi:hypothetical protein